MPTTAYPTVAMTWSCDNFFNIMLLHSAHRPYRRRGRCRTNSLRFSRGMSSSLSVTLLIFLTLVTTATMKMKSSVIAFTASSMIPSNSRWHRYQHNNPSSSKLMLSYNIDNNSNSDARAGMDGYSVMRRPASWDPNVDPEFDIPTSLRDSNQPQLSSEADNEWWSNRNSWQQQQSSPQQSTKSSNNYKENKSILDNAAEEASEIDLFQRTLETLDYFRILKALQDECTTVPARMVVQNARNFNSDYEKVMNTRNSAYRPLTADTVEGSQERYQAVREMGWLLNGGKERYDGLLDSVTWRNRLGYQQPIAGRPAPIGGNGFNLEAVLEGCENRLLEGYEILEISDMIDIMEDIVLWNRKGLRKTPEDIQFVELGKIADCIAVNGTLQDLLHNAFEDGEKGSSNQRRLSGKTFPKIGLLRARIRSMKADVMDTINRLISLPSIKSKLALDSGGALISEVGGSGATGGRLVIPVNAQDASKIGIVHDTSRSGKTVYCEPTEIVEPTNKFRQTESELRMEEARVWRMLTEQILLNRNDLETSVAAVGQLDLVYARYRLGEKISGVVPIVQNEGIISLTDAKHPVLLLRGNIDVVGSSISLGVGKNQGLVLTGPNAGGKTVVLKLLGLLALMARSGIPVPARSSDKSRSNGEKIISHDPVSALVDGEIETNASYEPRVDFFSPVLADIGDLQSVGSDLSTFSGHMLVCREVLNNAGKNALVLMDELGSGTDPAQGVAIAQALLEALVETGSRVAITTHYMQLKQLAAADDRFSVAGMQFVKGKPTYKLLPGTVGESFALAVAERLQLPPSVLKRATELLDSETRQMGDLLRDLEDQKMILDDQVALIESKKKSMEEMELKMKEEQMKMEKTQLSVRRDEARKFAQKLEEKEKILEDVLDRLKSDPSRRIVAKSWDDIKFVKRDTFNEVENLPSIIARKKAATAMQEADLADLVPIAELGEMPALKPGEKVIVCKQGPLFGREGDIIQVSGNKVEVRVSNMNVSFKLTQVALPPANKSWVGSPSSGVLTGKTIGNSVAAAAGRAIAAEKKSRPRESDFSSETVSSGSSIAIRTQSNTVDVLGCNLVEAQEKIKQKFSSILVSNQKTLYVLHGHGTGGVLKSKIRAWLRQESKLVKNFAPADRADGGDALTRVELR